MMRQWRRRGQRQWLRQWLRAILFAGAVAACGGQPAEVARPEPATAQAADVDAIVKLSQEGPVKATVSLSPKGPRLGDPLTLVLTVEADSGVTVEMPAFGEALGRFSIVDFTPRRETRADGSTVAIQKYTLHAPMSGRQRIPALLIEFVDERDAAKAAGTAASGDAASGDAASGDPASVIPAAPARVHELLTDEIAIEVASVLPDGAVVDELRPVRGELAPLASERVLRLWPVLLALVLGVGLALGFRWYRGWARERVRANAHDLAIARLRKLEARGLPAGAEVDGWYVELSAIIRRYLEDRFAVRAPELTTEEFLREARRSHELTQPHRELLTSFLERCDRVKFAAYVPGEAESREVLAAAASFLTETRLVKDAATVGEARAA